MSEEYISSTEVRTTDVICRRGIAGNTHPGYLKFRSVISANKNEYDKILSRDRDNFSREIWAEMKKEGIRFVREASDGSYLVLDDEKCARKIWSALRDYRGGGSSTLAVLPRPVKQQQQQPKKSNVLQEQSSNKPPRTKKQKSTHWMTVAAAASPVQTKDFDVAARSAITSLLENEALDAALRKNWGKNYEKKKDKFEEAVLTRYRAAAKKGMSIEDFSTQLLPVLLREASGVSAVVSESSKMTSLL